MSVAKVMMYVALIFIAVTAIAGGFGYLCGSLFGPWGLIPAIPVGFYIGWKAGDVVKWLIQELP